MDKIAIIAWVWGISTLIVFLRLRRIDGAWHFIDTKIVDAAWEAYSSYKFMKVLMFAIVIVISPYLAFLVITKPIRDKLKKK